MQYTNVGQVIDFINGLGMGKKIVISAKDSVRLLSNPPEIVSDRVNLVFRIKLADGSNLNIHVAKDKKKT